MMQFTVYARCMHARASQNDQTYARGGGQKRAKLAAGGEGGKTFVIQLDFQGCAHIRDRLTLLPAPSAKNGDDAT